MSILKAKNVMLKEHTVRNLEHMHKWFNDEELNYYTDDEEFETVSLESMKNYVEKRLIPCGFSKENDIIHLGIHKISGELIGFCMIAFIDHFNKKCKIGLTIGDKKEWGHGYATEMMNLLLNYCFNDLNMNRVGAEIYSYNHRSIKLFENLGFKQEGNIRKSVVKNDCYYDEYVYGLLSDEWIEMNR